MVLPSKGIKKAKKRKLPKLITLQEFRNRTSMNNRSITKMKRMKMINKSH